MNIDDITTSLLSLRTVKLQHQQITGNHQEIEPQIISKKQLNLRLVCRISQCADWKESLKARYLKPHAVYRLTVLKHGITQNNKTPLQLIVLKHSYPKQ